MRLVLENIPERVLDLLRRRAEAAGSTPEHIAEEILLREAGGAGSASGPSGTSFDELCGSLGPDPELDRIMREQRRPDRKLWE